MHLLAIPRGVNRQNLGTLGTRVHRGLVARYVDAGRAAALPLTVQIEATSNCNLRCPLCSFSREARAGRHLSPDELARILDWLPFRPSEVRLSGIGEPLVHPRFFELVDILSARGIDCEFYTNGTLLGRRGVPDAILSRLNIRMLSISCDGATRETFESMRAGAHFDAWCTDVRDFLAAARRARAGTLSAQAATSLSLANVDQLEDIIRLAARLGFAYIYIRDPMEIDETAAEWCPSAAQVAAVSANSASLRALGATLGIRVGFLFRRGVGSHGQDLATRIANSPILGLRCRQPWEYIFIRANGDIAPCCAVFGSGRMPIMGNIYRDDFGVIWGGERFRGFRTQCATGANALCQVCSWY